MSTNTRRRSRRSGSNSRRTTSSYKGSRNNNRRGSKRRMPKFNPSQFVNKQPVEQKQEVYEPKHTFDTFGLDERLVSNIHAMGIQTPTPVQDQAIPAILEGRDTLGVAGTGTGKTAAFLIPIINKTITESQQVTLVLAPTRELAIQIDDEFQKLTKGMKLFSMVAVGGISIRPQISKLRRHQHVIVGTPGRVKDLINRGHIKPERFSNVILDEADRMLDMGFIHDMRDILKRVPADRHMLLFSATMNDKSKKIVQEFMNDPAVVSVKKQDVVKSIEQDIVRFTDNNKFNQLVDMVQSPEFDRVIIFGQMKHAVESLKKKLADEGVRAESIHGNKSHRQRQSSLKRFKAGHSTVLVATDVAARGIHVDDVSHVINYELPTSFEDYVHRIGRTGRGKKKGKALTFVPQN